MPRTAPQSLAEVISPAPLGQGDAGVTELLNGSRRRERDSRTACRESSLAMMGPMPNDTGDPGQTITSADLLDWRKEVLDIWSTLVAIPVGLALAYSLARGSPNLANPTFLLLLLAVGGLVFASVARRIPYGARVCMLTLGLYVMWVAAMLRGNLAWGGLVLGALVVFTASVLLPVRWAIGNWVLSVIVMATAMALLGTGIVVSPFDPGALDPTDPSIGLTFGILHAVFAGIIGIAATLIVNRLSDSLAATRLAESSLRLREAHWRSLLDNAADLIVTVTRDHRVDFINHEVSDYGPGEGTDYRIGDLAPTEEERRRRRRAIDRVFETGDSSTLEADWVDREGVSHPWSMRFSPVLKEGEVDRVAIISTDLSERRELEEQLRQSQKMQAVGELTGGLAHDFNNLLTVVMGNLELIMTGLDEGGEAHKLASLALESAARGASITQRLLAFSRRQLLHPRAVDLGHLIIGMRELILRTVGQSIEVSIETGEGPLVCTVDAAQLENAVLNLAINGRDAMPSGGTLHVSCSVQRLPAGLGSASGAAEIEYVVLSVTDTGVGIPEDLCSQVFDPFFTTKGVGEGSGLGLSMVQGLVAQSGGHVRIASTVGEGTVVTLFFPRSDEQRNDSDRTVPVRTTRGTGELILVLEDDDAVQALSVRTLQRLGYRTIEASNGRQALEIIRGRDDIDLLFSDIVLPGGMSGVDLSRELRRAGPGLPILLTSGYSTDEDGAIAELGAEVLAKPFNTASLSSYVARVLGRDGSKTKSSTTPSIP